MKPLSHLRSQSGFTLVEIMIALLIMAGLSVLLGQSVKTGLDSRKKVQLQLSEESLIRDAMRLMVADVGSAFHFRDYTVANYNKVLELRKKKAQTAQGAIPGQVTSGAATGTTGSTTGIVSSGAQQPTTTTTTAPDPLASATPLPLPNQLTGFVGSDSGMTFTVRNHVRRFVDAKESDIARISYFIKSCRKNLKQTHYSSCLVRMESTIPTDEFPLSPADTDDAKGVTLVNNITEFKLRYIAAGATEFVESWDSLANSTNQATRNRFPDAVEITMTIQDKQNPESKPRHLSWLAPVRNSNNQSTAEQKADQESATGTQGTGTGTGSATGTGTGSTGRQQ